MEQVLIIHARLWLPAGVHNQQGDRGQHAGTSLPAQQNSQGSQQPCPGPVPPVNIQTGEAIDAALLSTDSLREIAARWAVSNRPHTAQRAHLPTAVVKAAAIEEVISGGKLLERLKELNRETASILREARTAGTKDNQLALKAIARAEKQLEL